MGWQGVLPCLLTDFVVFHSPLFIIRLKQWMPLMPGWMRTRCTGMSRQRFTFPHALAGVIEQTGDGAFATMIEKQDAPLKRQIKG